MKKREGIQGAWEKGREKGGEKGGEEKEKERGDRVVAPPLLLCSEIHHERRILCRSPGNESQGSYVSIIHLI